MVDVETLVKSLKPGLAAFGRFSMTPGSKMETCFFICDEKYRIDAVPSSPKIYFKAVMFEKQGTVPVAVLIKIEGIGGPYDTWWNFQAKGVQGYVDDMILQSHVLVHICSDQKMEKSIKVENSLKEPFEKFRESALKVGSWTKDQFICAHGEICKKYQSVQEMWDFLGNPDSKQKFSNN
ncbi:MAG: hypothetical protein ACUZ8O_15460 [Candidatus Anammoxibacter sp.]